MAFMDKIRKHALNELRLTIDGEDFIFHPKVVKKVDLVTKLAACDTEDIKTISGIYEDHLLQIFKEEFGKEPDFDPEVIANVISLHQNSLVTQLLIAYKMATEESIEKKMEEALSKN